MFLELLLTAVFDLVAETNLLVAFARVSSHL